MVDDDSPSDPTAPIALVMTTEGDAERAAGLADALIERRVAACVTLYDIRSVYRWEGEVVEDTEVQLVIKTDIATVARVRTAIAELHSYDIPEVVVIEGDAAADYAAWVADEVL